MRTRNSEKNLTNKVGNGRITKPTQSKKTHRLNPSSIAELIPLSSSVNRPTNKLIRKSRMYKVTETQPIDVAAHLQLLGESLITIGEYLKERDSPKTMTCSLSVLLNSLLCALAALICLTQQLPEMNGADHETLSQTLDNIAYVIPGL